MKSYVPAGHMLTQMSGFMGSFRGRVGRVTRIYQQFNEIGQQTAFGTSIADETLPEAASELGGFALCSLLPHTGQTGVF
jgi:hypothetical protein